MNMAMAKQNTWLMKGLEQEMETVTECSQRELFMMLDPQKDNARRKQVSLRGLSNQPGGETVLENTELDVGTQRSW